MFMNKLKNILRHLMSRTAFTRNLFWARQLHKKYSREHKIGYIAFLLKNAGRFYVQKKNANKAIQLEKLFCKVALVPVENEEFFYSIDCYKTLELEEHILDNCSVDYSKVVHESFMALEDKLATSHSLFADNERKMINAMKQYLKRCQNDSGISQKYKKQLEAIETLFCRPAHTFFEALQRILFFNQFLWQSRHKLNGLGHLDWLLGEMYRKDLEAGRLTKAEAQKLVEAFFVVLHENSWYKSGNLLGDTGQIIVLGGLEKEKQYKCNELTNVFIKVSMELRMPDPKILLRCSNEMPDALLDFALACIATGIGAPLISNDNVVIPALINFGYDLEDAYHYVTAACWEPLVLGRSCDQNNIRSVNFAEPLVKMCAEDKMPSYHSLEAFTEGYESHLRRYLEEILAELSRLTFEEDPLITLVSDSALESGKDIVRGGAKYANLGLTSVGLGTVVNSILNIKKLVFTEKRYALEQLNEIRKNNYAEHEALCNELRGIMPGYGSDENHIIALTKRIMETTSAELSKHTTKLGGEFKFGLSSPSYVTAAKTTMATFDGRKGGEAFSVNISANQSIAPTELISFAMKLDYLNNRINGNVVDFFVTPKMLENNISQYANLLKASFKGGLYQLQMNVVDSKTLIAAKANPELFPKLVVRVWGFSAYYKDLPEEYKEVLIKRALESERAA